MVEYAYQIFGLGYLPFKGFLPLHLPQPPPIRFQLCLNLVLSLDKMAELMLPSVNTLPSL